VHVDLALLLPTKTYKLVSIGKIVVSKYLRNSNKVGSKVGCSCTRCLGANSAGFNITESIVLAVNHLSPTKQRNHISDYGPKKFLDVRPKETTTFSDRGELLPILTCLEPLGSLILTFTYAQLRS